MSEARTGGEALPTFALAIRCNCGGPTTSTARDDGSTVFACPEHGEVAVVGPPPEG